MLGYDRGRKMEKRDLKITFHKAGNGKGSKISLPIPWLREIGITEDERDVELILDKKHKSLVIRKK